METFNIVVVVVAFLVSCFNLWDKIDNRVKAANAPTKNLEDRVGKLEQQNEKYDIQFSKDLRRLDAIEEGNKVTQRALLALLKHSIDGNEVEELRKASKELTEYLISR